MTIGSGAAYSTSIRQKLNSKSSTEAELVAVDDVFGQVLWTQNFMEEQGYDIGPAKVYQDNQQSVMLLETKGLASSSKRTRHIQIRYYFVADKIKSGDVTLEYDWRFLHGATSESGILQVQQGPARPSCLDWVSDAYATGVC
jgi:hypothetical protein